MKRRYDTISLWAISNAAKKVAQLFDEVGGLARSADLDAETILVESYGVEFRIPLDVALRAKGKEYTAANEKLKQLIAAEVAA